MAADWVRFAVILPLGVKTLADNDQRHQRTTDRPRHRDPPSPVDLPALTLVLDSMEGCGKAKRDLIATATIDLVFT